MRVQPNDMGGWLASRLSSGGQSISRHRSLTETSSGLGKIESAGFFSCDHCRVRHAAERFRVGFGQLIRMPFDIADILARQRFKEDTGAEVFSCDVRMLGVQSKRYLSRSPIRAPKPAAEALRRAVLGFHTRGSNRSRLRGSRGSWSENVLCLTTAVSRPWRGLNPRPR